MKPTIALLLLAVSIFAVQALTAPVVADVIEYCTPGDTLQCHGACAAAIPGSCVLTDSSCRIDLDVAVCNCEMICSYGGHDPSTGGQHHMAFVLFQYE